METEVILLFRNTDITESDKIHNVYSEVSTAVTIGLEYDSLTKKSL